LPPAPDREELLAEIQRLASAKGGRPTLEDLKADGRFSKSPYYTEFGSWNAAVRAAGLDGPEPREYAIPDEKLIKDLRRVADEKGSSPTREEIEECGAYSRSTYEKRFGTWNAALLAAGLELNKRKQAELICDQCGTDFQRPPSHIEREWTEHTFCSPECHGQWREGHIIGEQHPQWKPDTTSDYGKGWQSFRKEVIERDGEQCVRCGMDRETHFEQYGRDLSVHHIIPRSEFDDVEEANSLENTITVCAACHVICEKDRQ
jgi:hypothetical protein